MKTLSDRDTKTEYPNDSIRADNFRQIEHELAVSIETSERLLSKHNTIWKVVAGVLAILGTLVLLEMLARVSVCLIKPSQFGDPEYDSKYLIAREKLPAGTPCIYFLGTSYTSRGIYTDLIEDRLKRAGYPIVVRNLGCSGGYPMDVLFFLKEALRNSPGPFAIAYEVNHGGFNSTPEVINGHGKVFRESYLGGCEVSDWSHFKEADMWLKRNLYLVRYRAMFKKVLSSVPKYVFASDENVYRARTKSVHFESSPAGWAPVYPFLNDYVLTETMRLRQNLLGYLTPGSDGSKTKAKYDCLERVYELCRERHAPLLMVRIPMHPAFLKQCDRRMQVTAEQTAALFKQAADIEGATLIDIHDDQVDAHYVDCDHLNAQGAVAASNRIADALLTDDNKSLLQSLLGKGK